MDANTVTGANLWTSIKSLPGVYGCDPCRRTHDLGKWNISCSADSHTAIGEWIDTNMVNIWNSIPTQATLPKIGPFLIPERLSKGRCVSSSSSVASGLTDASPIDDYLKHLNVISRRLHFLRRVHTMFGIATAPPKTSSTRSILTKSHNS
jgi:hypothetical protein